MRNRRRTEVWVLRIAAVASAGLLMVGCSSSGGSVAPASRGAGSSADSAKTVPTALILDGSGSMAEVDAPGPGGEILTRMAAAAGAANTLIDALPEDGQFALVTYGTGTGGSEAEKAVGCGDVTTLVPLGLVDPATARVAVDTIVPSGFTPISAALRHAADGLPATGAQAIVLVSDGEDTCDAPPCDVATELHRERPGLAISTVGFRTGGGGDEDLACIASTTGGLFVTADDAGQLASRLQATQDLTLAKTALTGTGLAGAELGQSTDRIRAVHSDLPAVAGSGEVVIIWRDCDLTFTDGILTAIAPHDGGRTIDGIAVGSPLRDATELYGQPVGMQANPDGSFLSFLAADRNAKTAYKMTTNGNSADATISRIVLCKCLPGTGSAPAALTFGGTAQIRAGMREADLAAVGATLIPDRATTVCNSYTVPGAPDLTVSVRDGVVMGVLPNYIPSSGRVAAGVHTDEGIRIGNTAARVREVYRGATLAESYQGLGGTKLILASDGSGGTIGFEFSAGSDTSDSVPDSATVANIRAGISSLASGHEVCVG